MVCWYTLEQAGKSFSTLRWQGRESERQSDSIKPIKKWRSRLTTEETDALAMNEDCPVCGTAIVKSKHWRPLWSSYSFCSQTCARTERMAYALMTIGAGITEGGPKQPPPARAQQSAEYSTPPPPPPQQQPGIDPATVCPKCGKYKQARYNVCYNCNRQNQQERQQEHQEHQQERQQNAKPCVACGKPVMNPKYDKCYECGSAANRGPQPPANPGW